MTYPSAAEIEALLARVAPRSRSEHEAFRQAVNAAFSRDRGRSSLADGYPSSTMGGGRGGAELTSTEAAAEARLFPARGRSDVVRGHLENLYAHLVEEAGHRRAGENLLRLIQLAGGEDLVDNSRWCESHARAGRQEAARWTGTVGGRLSAQASLCEPCYDVVRRYLLRLPTVEEVQRYDTTGRWRVTGQMPERSAG